VIASLFRFSCVALVLCILVLLFCFRWFETFSHLTCAILEVRVLAFVLYGLPGLLLLEVSLVIFFFFFFFSSIRYFPRSAYGIVPWTVIFDPGFFMLYLSVMTHVFVFAYRHLLCFIFVTFVPVFISLSLILSRSRLIIRPSRHLLNHCFFLCVFLSIVLFVVFYIYCSVNTFLCYVRTSFGLQLSAFLPRSGWFAFRLFIVSYFSIRPLIFGFVIFCMLALGFFVYLLCGI